MNRDLVRLLMVNAYNTYRATLISGPKFTRELFEELSKPKVGDLVMEITTFGMEEKDHLQGIGRLIGVGYAPYFNNRKEAREAGYLDEEPMPERKVWDIKLEFDDGRVFRWENASFIKIKEDLA